MTVTQCAHCCNPPAPKAPSEIQCCVCAYVVAWKTGEEKKRSSIYSALKHSYRMDDGNVRMEVFRAGLLKPNLH